MNQSYVGRRGGYYRFFQLALLLSVEVCLGLSRLVTSPSVILQQVLAGVVLITVATFFLLHFLLKHNVACASELSCPFRWKLPMVEAIHDIIACGLLMTGTFVILVPPSLGAVVALAAVLSMVAVVALALQGVENFHMAHNGGVPPIEGTPVPELSSPLSERLAIHFAQPSSRPRSAILNDEGEDTLSPLLQESPIGAGVHVSLSVGLPYAPSTDEPDSAGGRELATSSSYVNISPTPSCIMPPESGSELDMISGPLATSSPTAASVLSSNSEHLFLKYSREPDTNEPKATDYRQRTSKQIPVRVYFHPLNHSVNVPVSHLRKTMRKERIKSNRSRLSLPTIYEGDDLGFQNNSSQEISYESSPFDSNISLGTCDTTLPYPQCSPSDVAGFNTTENSISDSSESAVVVDMLGASFNEASQTSQTRAGAGTAAAAGSPSSHVHWTTAAVSSDIMMKPTSSKTREDSSFSGASNRNSCTKGSPKGVVWHSSPQNTSEPSPLRRGSNTYSKEPGRSLGKPPKPLPRTILNQTNNSSISPASPESPTSEARKFSREMVTEL